MNCNPEICWALPWSWGTGGGSIPLALSIAAIRCFVIGMWGRRSERRHRINGGNQLNEAAPPPVFVECPRDWANPYPTGDLRPFSDHEATCYLRQASVFTFHSDLDLSNNYLGVGNGTFTGCRETYLSFRKLCLADKDCCSSGGGLLFSQRNPTWRVVPLAVWKVSIAQRLCRICIRNLLKAATLTIDT